MATTLLIDRSFDIVVGDDITLVWYYVVHRICIIGSFAALVMPAVCYRDCGLLPLPNYATDWQSAVDVLRTIFTVKAVS